MFYKIIRLMLLLNKTIMKQNKTKLLLVLILTLTIVTLKAQDKTRTQTISHEEVYDSLLKKHVSPLGLVNYKTFLEDKNNLQSYIDYLANHPPSKTHPKQEKLAYFINLYNAATVYLILENYPLKSIKDIENPWDKKFVKSGDKLYSLNEIEHKILRKMDEPRIHFAINCASYSCPDLLNEAFKAEKLEEQLNKVTSNFINSDKNQISENKVRLSKIFQWFKEDFKVNGKKNLIAFLNKYSSVTIKDKVKIQFLKYDWGLNQQE